MDNSCVNFFSRLIAKKTAPYDENSKLRRILQPFEIVLFCVGVVFPAFYWDIPNSTHKNDENMIYSALLSSAATFVTCMCCCELASLYPSSGAVYEFTYRLIGELPAFLIGWSFILTCLVQVVALTSSFGEYIDFCITETKKPPKYSFMFVVYEKDWYLVQLKPFDYYTVCMIAVCILLFSIPLKITRVIIDVIVVSSITIVLVDFIFLWLMVDISNVKMRPLDVPGLYKLTEGCFESYFIYHGFEVVLCLGEEVPDPAKHIPRSLKTVMKYLLVFNVLLILTLVAARFEPGAQAPGARAPMSYVFWSIGHPLARYLIKLGGIFAIMSAIYLRIYTVARLVYAMSKDGLLTKTLSYVDRFTVSPFVALLLSCSVVLAFSVLTKPTNLIVRTSWCAYLVVKSMIAICLILSRYRCEVEENGSPKQRWILFNYPSEDRPTKATQTVAYLCTCIVLLSFGGITTTFYYLVNGGPLLKSIDASAMSILFILFVTSFFALRRQTQNKRSGYTVIGFPHTVLLCLMWNLMLFSVVGTEPFIMYLGWIAIGLIHYFVYSYSHSVNHHRTPPEPNGQQL